MISSYVRQLAALTGESITEAVFISVKERLERLKLKDSSYSLAQELDAIAQRCASLSVQDSRSPEQIIGYDEPERYDFKGNDFSQTDIKCC